MKYTNWNPQHIKGNCPLCAELCDGKMYWGRDFPAATDLEHKLTVCVFFFVGVFVGILL